MSKDYLSLRKECFNKLPSANKIMEDLTLRKESESLKKRKEFFHSSLMSKRMQENTLSSLSNPFLSQSSKLSFTSISPLIHQSYLNSQDKLTFITYLLYGKSSMLNYPQPIPEAILVEEGIMLLSLYLDSNTDLSTKDSHFFFKNIFFCLADTLTSQSTSLTIKYESSLILVNITNNDKLCNKYSKAFCDQVFLFNLNKYFGHSLDSLDKKLIANVILIISNIISENSSNYLKVIEQITFLPILQSILNSYIKNPWVKFSEVEKDSIVLLENSLFLLYNFFFYMSSEKMPDYIQFETMTIKLLLKAYQESHQEMFLLFLEIAVLVTKSKEVTKVLFINNKESNIGLLTVMFQLINNNSSIQIAINAIRLISNVYRSGNSKVKKVILDMNIEEVVFKNLYLCTNEDALSIYLDLIALFIKKREIVTQQKLNQYKDVINALSSIFIKAKCVTTKVEVVKTMRVLIEMNNDDNVFKYFFKGEFWKVLMNWLKDNTDCNSKNAPLVYRILRLIDETIGNCPFDLTKINAIKIELQNQGLDSVMERMIDSPFHQIAVLSKTTYYRYWSKKENMYGTDNNFEMDN